jgi:hypothetical protein
MTTESKSQAQGTEYPAGKETQKTVAGSQFWLSTTRVAGEYVGIK